MSSFSSHPEAHMNLRIRSLRSRQTAKIQIPTSSCFQDLKIAIASTVSADPASVHISLNSRDELLAAPNESLLSAGLTSGDLIFYTFSPDSLPTEPNLIEQGSCFQPGSKILEERMMEPQQSDEIPPDASSAENTILDQKIVHENNNTSHSFAFGELPISPLCKGRCFPQGDTHPQEFVPSQDVTYGSDNADERADGSEIDYVVHTRDLNLIPRFLCKFLEVEKGNIEGDSNKLLITFIHAVLLETGFVCLNSKKEAVVNRFSLYEGWATTAQHIIRVEYSAPGLLRPEPGLQGTVGLRFVTLRDYVSVYGSVMGEPLSLTHLSLDASLFGPSIMALHGDGFGGESRAVHGKKLFELWRIVKDKLSLPLLIGLCEKTGLQPPPSFMRLPFDLKNRILEFLPGVDIARIACVCSELKCLAANDDLWKQKCIEEFQMQDKDDANSICWEKTFAVCWKRLKLQTSPAWNRHSPFQAGYCSSRRRLPFGYPSFFFGGDYDRFPGFVGGLPFRAGHAPSFRTRPFSFREFGGFNI